MKREGKKQGHKAQEWWVECWEATRQQRKKQRVGWSANGESEEKMRRPRREKLKKEQQETKLVRERTRGVRERLKKIKVKMEKARKTGPKYQ